MLTDQWQSACNSGGCVEVRRCADGACVEVRKVENPA
jgi:hypothetical protein